MFFLPTLEARTDEEAQHIVFLLWTWSTEPHATRCWEAVEATTEAMCS